MKRIQRKRSKGFKLPPNTVCINRPTKWSNPFVISEELTREESIKRFKECVRNNAMAYCYFDEVQANLMFKHFEYISKNLNELKKYDHIACFCPVDKDCHGDVLIELLNEL